MTIKKTMVAVVLAVVATGSALASDADILREAKDRADITQLMWNYCRALDTFNEDAYAGVYTEDGEFHAGTAMPATKGRAALKKMVVDLKKGRAEREAKGEPKTPPMHHIITNSTIEFVDKDHARYHSYWMTVFEGVGRDVKPNVAAAGRGIDEIVRVNGKWLIQKRDVQPKD
jgi:3-phenylpropionate/cinnamic acid dioxygenase small subunit